MDANQAGSVDFLSSDLQWRNDMSKRDVTGICKKDCRRGVRDGK